MKKCEFCGKEYDPDYEEDTFACECCTLTYHLHAAIKQHTI